MSAEYRAYPKIRQPETGEYLATSGTPSRAMSVKGERLPRPRT